MHQNTVTVLLRIDCNKSRPFNLKYNQYTLIQYLYNIGGHSSKCNYNICSNDLLNMCVCVIYFLIKLSLLYLLIMFGIRTMKREYRIIINIILLGFRWYHAFSGHRVGYVGWFIEIARHQGFGRHVCRNRDFGKRAWKFGNPNRLRYCSEVVQFGTYGNNYTGSHNLVI